MVRHSRDYITDISVKPKHIYKDFERNEYEVLVPLFLLLKTGGNFRYTILFGSYSEILSSALSL